MNWVWKNLPKFVALRQKTGRYLTDEKKTKIEKQNTPKRVS